MTTKDLDAKLRARGKEKLHTHIRRVFAKLREDLDQAQLGQGYGTYAPSGLVKQEYPDRILACWEVLPIIEAAIEARCTPVWEQREVDNFLADLEKVKASVEELEQRYQ